MRRVCGSLPRAGTTLRQPQQRSQRLVHRCVRGPYSKMLGTSSSSLGSPLCAGTMPDARRHLCEGHLFTPSVETLQRARPDATALSRFTRVCGAGARGPVPFAARRFTPVCGDPTRARRVHRRSPVHPRAQDRAGLRPVGLATSSFRTAPDVSDKTVCCCRRRRLYSCTLRARCWLIVAFSRLRLWLPFGFPHRYGFAPPSVDWPCVLLLVGSVAPPRSPVSVWVLADSPFWSTCSVRSCTGT